MQAERLAAKTECTQARWQLTSTPDSATEKGKMKTLLLIITILLVTLGWQVANQIRKADARIAELESR